MAPQPASAAPALTDLPQLLDALPTLPVVALRLGDVLHSRRASVRDVAELICSDPSLSAKLLRLVNSAYFAIPGGVSDVARAIPFVGFNTIYQLVVSVSVLDTLKTPSGAFDPRPLWVHSIAVASTARVLAEDLRQADPGAMFTAGLLHDMGKIALAKVAPVAFLTAVREQAEHGVSSTVAEERAGLPCHDKVGASLARRWRLPVSLCVPIEAHHSVLDPASRSRLGAAARTGAEIIAVSNQIAREAVSSAGGLGDPPDVDDPRVRELLQTLGLGEQAIASLHRRVALQLERSRAFLALLEG